MLQAMDADVTQTNPRTTGKTQWGHVRYYLFLLFPSEPNKDNQRRLWGVARGRHGPL